MLLYILTNKTMGYYVKLFSCNILIPHKNAQDLINDILEFEEEFKHRKIFMPETKEFRAVSSWHVQLIDENPSDDTMDLKEILANHDWAVHVNEKGYNFTRWLWEDGDPKLDRDYIGYFLEILAPHVDNSEERHAIFIGEDGKLFGAVYKDGYCMLTNL